MPKKDYTNLNKDQLLEVIKKFEEFIQKKK